MYKNLNITSLGISARQNELIELALTYKFDSFDLDIDTFLRQLESKDLDYAKRFIDSANINIGTFELPIRWQGGVADFKADLVKFDSTAPAIASIGATRCVTTVPPFNSEQAPYHEYFETVRGRFAEISEVLEKHGMTLALGFLAASHHREGQAEQFIATAEALTTLVNTISTANIGIELDLWDWHLGGGTLEQIKQIPVTQIFNVRLADLPENADLATATESDRLMPGSTGVLPCAEVLEHLKTNGYTGLVTVSCHESQFQPRNNHLAIDRVAKALQSVLEPQPVAPSSGEGEEAASEGSEEVASTSA